MNATMTIRTLLQGALLAACTLAVSLPALAEPGNLIKETSTMTMSGMEGMAPRTFSNTLCMAAKKPDFSKIVHQRKDCTVTKFDQGGNHYSFHMVCTGQTPMTADGSFTSTGDGGYTGETHISSTADGHPMNMVMSYVGKRIGSCNYTPPKTQ